MSIVPAKYPVLIRAVVEKPQSHMKLRTTHGRKHLSSLKRGTFNQHCDLLPSIVKDDLVQGVNESHRVFAFDDRGGLVIPPPVMTCVQLRPLNEKYNSNDRIYKETKGSILEDN
jgi:hypothetical protein